MKRNRHCRSRPGPGAGIDKTCVEGPKRSMGSCRRGKTYHVQETRGRGKGERGGGKKEEKCPSFLFALASQWSRRQEQTPTEKRKKKGVAGPFMQVLKIAQQTRPHRAGGQAGVAGTGTGRRQGRRNTDQNATGHGPLLTTRPSGCVVATLRLVPAFRRIPFSPAATPRSALGQVPCWGTTWNKKRQRLAAGWQERHTGSTD
ncbi:hypothetical protein QBC47DRAFT_215119 [Echria macrotheca]|uniref:Uncharacterized protein n=1 Tax=Echria macrotheca TaxID=438768 RepID=A0AAJ0B9R1_9PEZI|nr:hypothetical protein QBC47DRAFT_215119 [Echria macrotheca]